ncbi:YdhK family protein [Planococcus sp. YIM B11945]|uniref:YdhK family protein n=1 Tax=Planococcus sp. YIM B11945 TaxID=3435410 RepID=UPI003D7D7956
MKKNKFMMGTMVALTAFSLAACTSGEESTPSSHGEMEMQTNPETKDNSAHSSMNHSSSGEIPEGLKTAENPTFTVGSKAVIQADHMDGMDGAEATISGAFDTTVYAVSFTPTTGGEKVTNHKWVIHEELENAGEEPLEPGAEVTIAADHMEGMNGAKATIDAAEDTTVYMVDFTPTTGGDEMKNHKWVTESELTAE